MNFKGQSNVHFIDGRKRSQATVAKEFALGASSAE